MPSTSSGPTLNRKVSSMAMKPWMRVLVLDPIDPAALRCLSELYDVAYLPGLQGDTLVGEIRSAEVVVLRSGSEISGKAIRSAKSLRLIARAGVGLDNIDLEAASACGIQVVNFPTASTISVAELTVGLMFSLVRRINIGDRDMRAGRWQKEKLVGVELTGKCLAVIGFGHIGERVAMLARGIGMEVVAVVARATTERARELEQQGVRLVSLPEAFSMGDVVSLHLPLTAATRGLVDAKLLAFMKASSYLINTARAGVVDEGALFQALASGRIAGAGIDVFSLEEARAFADLDSIVITPHIGAMTAEAQQRVGRELVRAIGTALDGALPIARPPLDA